MFCLKGLCNKDIAVLGHKLLLKIYDEDIIHTASGGANDHFFDDCAGIAFKLENPCYPLQHTIGNIFRA